MALVMFSIFMLQLFMKRCHIKLTFNSEAQFLIFVVRYQQFEEELELYAKQVEEIQYWGNVEEIFRYQKQTQNLENKLIAAMEKIDKLNEEEVAFRWETTQYPLRKKIADRLVPFKKLFDSGCDFLIKHESWINSRIGSFDPEEIDSDAATAYRFHFNFKPVSKKIHDNNKVYKILF